MEKVTQDEIELKQKEANLEHELHQSSWGENLGEKTNVFKNFETVEKDIAE